MKIELVNWLLKKARKLAAVLVARDDGPFAFRDEDEDVFAQANFSWDACTALQLSQDQLAQLSQLQRNPTVWFYVETTLASSKASSDSLWSCVDALVCVVCLGLAGDMALKSRGRRTRAERLRDYSLVLALPAAVIDLQLAQNYLNFQYRQSEKLRVQLNGDRRAESLLRTSAGKHDRAGQFFAARNEALYKHSKHKLPAGAKGFCEAAPLLVEPVHHVVLSAEKFTELLQTVAKLKQSDPATHMFLVLVLWCGLRANEAVFARCRWVIDSTSVPVLHISATDDFKPKNGRSRSAQLLPAVAKYLRQHEGKYLVSEHKSERERAYAKALFLLKKLEIPDKKPAHYLRRVYYTAASRKWGKEVARKSTGHVNHEVGIDSYLFSDFPDELLKLWVTSPKRCLSLS